MLPKGIGDVVYGLALAQALHALHPELEIHWAVDPRALALLQHAPAIRAAYPYTTNAQSLWRLRRLLAGQDFDVLLNLGMYLHALPPTLLAKARRTLCLGPGYAKDRLQWFHDETIPVAPGIKVQDVFSAAGRYLGLAPGTPEWTWKFSADEQRERAGFFSGSGSSPRVVLVPCSGRAEKDWPADRWAELAGRLRAQLGAFVVVAGGPSPAERQAASVITRAVPEVHHAVGDGLGRMLWILSGSDLVVAPDTGPLHMARALGVPLLGLYGHTDPRRYGPPEPFAGELIDRYGFDALDAPNEWNGTGGRADRMHLIPVDEVLASCLRILNDPVSVAPRQKAPVA